MPTWPAKTNYATGDVLTAAQMQDIGNALNSVGSAQYAAGKNKLINGDFFINQRGFTSTTTQGTYTFDRWRTTAVGNGTATFSAQTFTPGTAPVAGYEGKNYLRIVTTGQSATNTFTDIRQIIEDVRTLAGQTATVSFWAKAASGTPKVAVEFQQIFGTSGSPSATVQVYAGQVTLSTSWARYSLTVAIPSISGKTISTTEDSQLTCELVVSAGSDFNARTGSLGIQTNTFEFWGVQLEAASVATPFQTATGTLAGELAACQRYYFRFGGDSLYQHYAMGMSDTTTSAQIYIQHPVPMRANPTTLEFTNLQITDNSTYALAVTLGAITDAGKNGCRLGLANATGATANRTAFLRSGNSLSGYIALGAEL